MKALVGAFNQEEALIGAFSVIVKTDGSFAALRGTLQLPCPAPTLPTDATEECHITNRGKLPPSYREITELRTRKGFQILENF